MNILSISFDVVIALIILAFLINGVKRGLVSTLILMVSWIISFAAAVFFSGIISSFVYDGIIGPNIEKGVEQAIAEKAPVDLVASINKEIDKMPKFVQNFADFAFGDIEKEINNCVNEEIPKIPSTVSQTILKPVITAVMNVILFFFLFMIFSFVMHSISRVFRGRIRIPLIGQLNSILGGVMGAVQGIIIVAVLIVICELLIATTNNSLKYLNSNITQDTYIYKTISECIPMGKITND